MEVGDLISLYRKQAGLTIDELAEKSGVPKGTLNKITGGITKAPTLPNMKAIARALGKTLADFDDLPIQKIEKSPDTTEDVPGEDLTKIFNYLQDSLVAAGLLNEGQDLTDRQADVLIAVCQIIHATFSD